MVERQSDIPGRKPGDAKLPRVSPGRRVYAVGDIHGRFDLLLKLLATIREDALRRRPGDEACTNVLIYIGDYVDRGPESFAVVDYLIHDPHIGFETVFLKGNHEDMLVRFVSEGALGEAWMMNGGVATLRSYGVNAAVLVDDPDPLDAARREFVKVLPQSHRDFYKALKLSHVDGDYVFVHAGVRPGVALGKQNEADMLWIRGEFLDSDADFGRMVVHGHSIRPIPDIQPNRIGIDTGAFYTNRLTCLVLEGEDRRFLQT
ncbi:MAG: serine/threonine protein phosphatase [Rhodospirillales bacterium]|nr:serine/threonine protein phosphatase [Rhodospirillales bacterium]